jgi:hypothetical protein
MMHNLMCVVELTRLLQCVLYILVSHSVHHPMCVVELTRFLQCVLYNLVSHSVL